MVPGADPHDGICSFPGPALLHEGRDPFKTVLQASQQSSSSSVCVVQSLVMKATHINKPMICSLAAHAHVAATASGCSSSSSQSEM